MYLIGGFPPIVPIVLLAPALIGLFLSRIRKGQLFDKRSASIMAGMLLGSFAHQGLVYFLFTTRNESRFFFQRNLMLASGILLPMFFGALLFVVVNRAQIKLFSFSAGGFAAGALYVIFSAAPIFLSTALLAMRNFILGMFAIFTAAVMGFWMILNEENYNWKYFIIYVILSIPLSLVYSIVFLAYSSQ